MINIIVNSGYSFFALRKSLVKFFLKKSNINLFVPDNIQNILNEFKSKKLKIKKIKIRSKKNSFIILIKNSLSLIGILKKNESNNTYLIFGTYMNLIFGSLSFFIDSKKNIYVFTGLGSFFNTNNYILIFFVKFFFNILLLRKKSHFIFYNVGDRNYLVQNKFFNRTSIINGSGIKINNTSLKKKIDKKVKFVFYSRLNYDKGIIQLINAINIVNKKGFKEKFEIYIYGLFDNNPSSLKKKNLLLLIRNIENCSFSEVAYKVNLKKILGDKHVFILPSHGEGLPKTALEAMNFCNALLLSKISGHSKLINKKKLNGLYFEKKNEIDLSNKIIWMIKNKKKLPKLMLNSFKNLEFFSQDLINSKFYEISK